MRNLLLALFGLVCLVLRTNAWAGSFQQAYEAALLADATYQAARAEFVSVQQNLPMARASLLPSVSLSVGDSKVDGTREIDVPGGRPSTSTLDYRAPVQSLNLRYPLFNLEGTRKVTFAEAQASYAEMVLATHRADLLERLGTAWLQQLVAEQAVKTTGLQLEVARAQMEVANRYFKQGEGTRPEVSDAQAAFEMAKADEQEARNNLDLANLALRQITGANTGHLPEPWSVLSTQFMSAMPAAKQSLQDLLERAATSSPGISARRRAVDIAKAAVARNEAGHYPRLELVASATRSKNESLSTLNQSVRQRSLGLQLNVPLYSGGYVNASVAQALADQEKAESELAAEQQLVERDVTKFYSNVSNSMGKLKANQAAVSSAALALEAARKSLLAGFGMQSDVLAAQRKLLQARYALAQTMSDYILAGLRLGIRSDGDIQATVARIDELLHTVRVSAP